ncbi:GNAT family N-acetyltransferase [Candidatus Chloroploca sp. Khr17]|uniref:GNAT family N-acetyltransferase n=1 Tax=Candidatus Chloroploca sp. Khr17 TaxID=2496869 RepID=UPI0013EC5DB4|nr:GNAT family N-acetyltransferase [Candidatus Chloroploca sp. Khr17]
MHTSVNFAPASALSMEALADLFTRSFEAYFYSGVTTPETLSRRIASENIDLFSSLILCIDGQPSGVALLARRGARAWCGGFGIVPEHRGKGYAKHLTAAMIEQAQKAGARQLTLEVLTRNIAALRTYEHAGMQVTRRLLIMAWHLGDDEFGRRPRVDELEAETLVLDYFADLHPAHASWQREPATLLALPNLRGMVLREDGDVTAYALVTGDEISMRLFDLGACDEMAARELIHALQAHTANLTCINEPADSPLTGAFLRSGFVVPDEQYELTMAL